MQLGDVIKSQKEFFNSNATKDVKFRIENLQKLYSILQQNRQNICDALYADLNKSYFEATASEYNLVLADILDMIKHLPKWSKVKKVKTPLQFFPASTKVYREPFGSVLVMSPWNYPFMLALVPLVGAIGAGNCVVLKPSKTSKNTSQLIHKLINENFPSNYIYCVDADAEYDQVTSQVYDFIFFTGSENVGKQIMQIASKNLTPVVLELGGKSPCIVDKDADLDITIRRLLWGKMLNSGQTCVAPDYVFVHSSIKDQFVEKMKHAIQEKYSDCLTSKVYPHIINQKHFNRLTGLIARHPNVYGGQSNAQNFAIAPCLMLDANFDSEIMQEEIFGPILPIIEFENIDQVIASIKSKKKPLALYLFSQNKNTAMKVISEVSYGSGCINDCTIQVANNFSPFGGVGASGMGNYHAKYSFETFSRPKGVLTSYKLGDMQIRMKDFDKINMKMIDTLLNLSNKL